MSKPIIVGISANEKPISADIPIVHLSSSRHFADGVKAAGGLPVYLPISQPDLAKSYIDTIDALILTGGQDIHPSLYGGHLLENADADYLLERDLFEQALLKEALAQRKPILAVCRGMQLLNVTLGGSLFAHIDNHSQGLPLGTSHTIELESDSQLAQLLPDGLEVNSVHHQALDQLGQGLEVEARDPRDGIVEAVSLEDYPLLAVQWHPEFLIDNPAHQQLFNRLISFAKEQI
ncbi:gamma-glutamyl-gamma-aminobutyrate hydrolase family protein [Streptococcus loxodontisalivarius]|uniref:Glutamine amidotransferase n=1 Tax=Streptococcus loxodontisalivarius TaxID=1349415 RepID=A0ABS2PS97_9STRE|nr:gamma-glutamyl-gamma-aminobutyrate hydrolase family protein [Streptococcus loxodontisalivarius]MBM7642912.1 putative glutamine amidotransferase [Streptococcus loxodontisalivarius]